MDSYTTIEYNSTQPGQHEDRHNDRGFSHLSWNQNIKTVLYFTTFVAAFFLNLAMIIQQSYRLRRNSCTPAQKMRRILLLNLGVAQLMFSFWVILVQGLWETSYYWYAGNVMCKIVMCLNMLFRTSTLYSVMAVLVAHLSLRLSKTVTPVMHLRFIVPVWTMSTLQNIYMLVVFKTAEFPDQPDFEQCVSFLSMSPVTAKVMSIGIHFILGFVLPFLLTVFLVVIGIHLAIKGNTTSNSNPRKHGRQQEEEVEMEELMKNMGATNAGTANQSEAPTESFTIPLALPVIYFAFWMPFYVCFFIHLLEHYRSACSWLSPWFYLIGNSAPVFIALFAVICSQIKEA